MIRAAKPGDGEAMGLLRRRACRVAYDGVVDPSLLDGQEDVGVWGQRVEVAPEGALWVLAENSRGREFFEGLGWKQEPGIEDNDPSWGVLSYRYRRSL
jgi:hypothetical protein